MIYLVGAGPGDPGLITVRGRELLARAQIILHDALVSEDVLRLAADDAERILVGKRRIEGSPLDRSTLPRTVTAHTGATPSQTEINRLLVRIALDHPDRIVVRLKGGDPLLFGRGAEEALALAEAGIPFEIVAGVSSVLGATASAGIPLTHRDSASAVAVLTGSSAEGGAAEHDYKALARMKGTLVFLMAAGHLESIARKLIDAGLDPGAPAAVIQWGTLPWQRVVTATAETIGERARDQGVSSPSLLIVGDVVALRERLAWFEVRPLLGKKILLTQVEPSRDSEGRGLVERLGERGAHVVARAMLEIRPLDPDPLDRELRNLASYTDVIFTSKRAVEIVAARMVHLHRDARIFSGAVISAIGRGTAAALEGIGLRADLTPRRATAEGLLEVLGTVEGRRFLIPRARHARHLLADRLGACAVIVPIYDAVPADHTDLAAHLSEFDVIVFRSARAVEEFLRQFPSGVFSGTTKALAGGPVTAERLRASGIEPIVAKAPDDEAIVAAIMET